MSLCNGAHSSLSSRRAGSASALSQVRGGVPISEVFSSQASPLRKVKITSKVPRKLPKLAARRPEGAIEKVMPSASNVEKVGIPLPKVKEKVEKRGKYLKTMVDSGKDGSCYMLSRYCPASPINLPNLNVMTVQGEAEED